MLTLAATFEKSNGKQHCLRLKDADPSKTPEEIKASLVKLTKLDLFEKDGVGLFKKAVGAKWIETIVTPLFDKKDETSAMTTDAAIDRRPEESGTEIQEPAGGHPRGSSCEYLADGMPANQPLKAVQISDQTQLAKLGSAERGKREKRLISPIGRGLSTETKKKRRRLLERIRKRKKS